jgi:acetyl esterase/lipase
LKALKRGYAVVSVNYRLSEEAKFPAQIYDIKAAIRFIRANADKFNLNPDKIALWGVSAGGNLAALAGTSAGVKELEDLNLGNPYQSSKVQVVVDWYGSINYLTMDDQFKQSGLVGQVHNSPDSIESELLGKPITEVPSLVRMANPETYITPDDPPFFIQHGTKDTLIPVQQSVEFAEKLQKVIGKDKVTVELFNGAVHGDSVFFTSKNVNKVLYFIDKYLKCHTVS